MPKISRYNHFQPWRDGNYIAYNAHSGAVAVMTGENYEVYNRLVEKLSHSSAPELTSEEQELLQQLQYGRFVYGDDEDEFESLKFRHNMTRYDQTRLGLVLAPTLACNMACEYCYEENKRGRMSAAVIEALIDYVEKQARGLSLVDIGWYGGEPLLAMDIIEDITQTMLELGEEYKFTYTSSMISNGYLLTRENVDRLRDLQVSVVQVTIDGPARIHNKKRPLKNGRESFEAIVENIAYAVTKIAVGVRVNVDKTFTTEIIQELLDELKAAGLKERVGIYFGQLEPATTACANIADACYDTIDFSRIETEFYRVLLENGFTIQKLPSPMTTFCMAQNANALLVDPEGYLYRCYNHVGEREKSHGNILSPINYQHPNFLKLFAFNPFEDEICTQCDILPICMGGCPSRRADRGLKTEDMCESWRHNLQPMLEIIAMSRQQQAQAAAQAAAAASSVKEQS